MKLSIDPHALRPRRPALAASMLPPALGLSLACLCSAALGQPAQTQPPPAAIAPLACLILPERVADIGSAVIGIVDAIEVERGDPVRKGQVLIRLRADVERASSEVARSRAQSEAELRGAVAARDLARLKLERSRTLKAENFISAQAVEQAQAELRVAHEKVAQAEESLRTLAQEVSMSDAQASQRILRSPFDGVVIERYANPGERFEDKPLLKLAAIQRLRVEVVAPTSLFGSLRPGQELTVYPELPGATPRAARIAQIDRVLDPASNTFRMRLDLPNPDTGLPAGLRCKIDLGLQSAIRPAAPNNGAAAR